MAREKGSSHRYFGFHVVLLGIDPAIWRLFLLPADGTFADLHDAILDSFDWSGAHLFEFRDKDGRRTIARADFDDPEADEQVPTVGELALVSFFTKYGKKCTYIYDWGDEWWHEVEFLGLIERPDKFRRRLCDGERAAPLEDCGGPSGYYLCLEAAAGSDDDDIVDGWKQWVTDWDPDAFDLPAQKKKFDR